MTRTINIHADVPPNRTVQIELPADVPVGPAEIEVTVRSDSEARIRTFGDFLHSEYFGMWRDRDDIGDSVEYARRLREQAWKRSS